MFYQKLLMRKNEIDSQLASLKKEIEELPPGELHLRSNGKYTKWFYHHNDRIEYIPKKQENLAKQLAVRKYKTVLIKELETEKQAIEAYIKCMDRNSFRTTDMLKNDSGFKPVAGFNVRSKSESLIVSALYLNHIPFRYECALHLGEMVVYLDFTILHPVTKKIYYYEHFGMMDNPEYAHAAYRKLELYSGHGIIPTINLLTTYETRYHPLDYEAIDKLIKEYFL